jgi:tetratricopeptide (TPR) repeat protein
MSKEEIQMLKKSVGEYILMNSFLSTSLDRQQARSFLLSTDPSDDVEQVFFEIDADPRLDNIKPFRNITSSSYFPGEEEVLFMVGTIFRLVQMKRDSDGIWNIRMMLCSENDHQLQSLFEHMKNELGAGETNLLHFGDVLRRMGKLDDAEKYYHCYLDQLSADHPDISSCYHALGSVTDDNGDYDSSLKWHNKSLEINMRTLKSDHPNIANTHYGIANVHRKKGDYALALESYEKALMIWKKAHGEDHPLVATCLNNMGIVYDMQKEYSDLGASHNNIGVIHDCLGHYDQALEHYNSSLRIKSKSLPPRHPSIAMTLENIGLIYEQKRDFQQALSYFDKAAKIYRHSLSSTHPYVIQIEESIKRVSSKLK